MSKTSRLPLSSLITILVLIWLVYVFFSGGMYQFYASGLFLFYALTKKMWVSVVLLGGFQTLLLIPLRIIRVIRSNHLDEFQKEIDHLPDEILQRRRVKQQFRFGNRFFLFFLIEFLIQLTTFLTIGRLFLTDFYSRPIATDKLYQFVPYPAYPIQDTFFKIPYPAITQKINLGGKALLILWLGLIILQVTIIAVQSFIRRRKNKLPAASPPQSNKYKSRKLSGKGKRPRKKALMKK